MIKHLGNFYTSEGSQFGSEQDLREYLQNNDKIYINKDRIVDTSAVLAALEDPVEYVFQKIVCKDTPTIIHGCLIEEGSKYFTFGILNLNEEEYPTLLEQMLSTFAFASPEPIQPNKDHLWIIPKDIQHKDLLKSALMAEHRSFFHFNAESIFTKKNPFIPVERVNRCLINAYAVHLKKYCFLELYRALETFSLSSLLNDFQLKFMQDAKAITEKILEDLKNERQTLAASIFKIGTTSYYLEIYLKTIQLKNSGNSYANTILEKVHNSIKDKKSRMSEQEWGGVCAVYYIRCSIAHAGSNNIVYEDYPDADELLTEIIPMLEESILHAIGYEI